MKETYHFSKPVFHQRGAGRQRRQLSSVRFKLSINDKNQRAIIALDRQGTQQQRPESPTVTPPDVHHQTPQKVHPQKRMPPVAYIPSITLICVYVCVYILSQFRDLSVFKCVYVCIYVLSQFRDLRSMSSLE